MKYKLFLAFAIALITSTLSFAQTHNIWAGAGCFFQSGKYVEADTGLSYGLQYGFEKKLGDSWAIMPGIGVECLSESAFRNTKEGADYDHLTNIEVFLCGMYRIGNARLGLGPQLSFETERETFYIDADPQDPRNGMNKYKSWDIGIKPVVMFDVGSRFFWGAQAFVGLRDLRPSDVSGTVRIRTVSLIFGVKF